MSQEEPPTSKDVQVERDETLLSIIENEKGFDPVERDKDKYHKLKAGLFLTSLTGMSLLGGFGRTIAMSKKQDPHHFGKGMNSPQALYESGVSLATRALARATLYSVTGVGLICFVFWKAVGAHSLPEFRQKMGNMMPKLSKKNENPGRNEFATIRDLFNYIIDEDKIEKARKEAAKEASLLGITKETRDVS